MECRIVPPLIFPGVNTYGVLQCAVGKADGEMMIDQPGGHLPEIAHRSGQIGSIVELQAGKYRLVLCVYRIPIGRINVPINIIHIKLIPKLIEDLAKCARLQVTDRIGDIFFARCK